MQILPGTWSWVEGSIAKLRARSELSGSLPDTERYVSNVMALRGRFGK